MAAAMTDAIRLGDLNEINAIFPLPPYDCSPPQGPAPCNRTPHRLPIGLLWLLVCSANQASITVLDHIKTRFKIGPHSESDRAIWRRQLWRAVANEWRGKLFRKKSSLTEHCRNSSDAVSPRGCNDDVIITKRDY
jgi:hypothetical protein